MTRFPPGKVVAPATKGGLHFLARQGGCMVFAAKGGIKNGAEGAVPPQWNGTSYLPRAEPSTRPGGVSRSRTEPLAPRAVRPGGAINPHARKGVSTFGNTSKHRLSLSPDPDPNRAEGRLNPQARQGAALKDGKRYLWLPYLPVLPDPNAFFPLLS